MSTGVSPETADAMRSLDVEFGPQSDPTLMPAAQGRAASAHVNTFWNRDLPPVASTHEVFLPEGSVSGAARTRLRVIVPPRARAGAIVFVHGGGFAFCSPETHERFARLLALDSGLPVLLPDYRLAPEHPYPAGLSDVKATLLGAFAACAGLPVAHGPLLVAGDSAGANLAVSALLDGVPGVAGALLFYGVYGADFETQSYRDFADGPGLTRGKMRRFWDWYCPAAMREDALASPLKADDAALRALPPLWLSAAAIDPLLSDTLIFRARLAALGRADPLEVVPGVIHGFLQMSRALPAAREAIRRAGEAARRMS